MTRIVVKDLHAKEKWQGGSLMWNLQRALNPCVNQFDNRRCYFATRYLRTRRASDIPCQKARKPFQIKSSSQSLGGASLNPRTTYACTGERNVQNLFSHLECACALNKKHLCWSRFFAVSVFLFISISLYLCLCPLPLSLSSTISLFDIRTFYGGGSKQPKQLIFGEGITYLNEFLFWFPWALT